MEHLNRMLQVPANKKCADCTERNPRFASVTHGVFLCNRCFGVHRSMGTHISRTRSVGLDRWSAEQVKAMEGGNEAASKVWEVSLRDEERIAPDVGDYERERFIRDKYERMRWRSSTPAAALHPHPAPREDKAAFTTTSRAGLGVVEGGGVSSGVAGRDVFVADLIDFADSIPSGGEAVPSSTSSSSSAGGGGVGGGSRAADDLYGLGVLQRGAGGGSRVDLEEGQNDAHCRLIKMKMMMMEGGGGGQGGGWMGGGGRMEQGMPMEGGGGGIMAGGGMMGGGGGMTGGGGGGGGGGGRGMTGGGGGGGMMAGGGTGMQMMLGGVNGGSVGSRGDGVGGGGGGMRGGMRGGGGGVLGTPCTESRGERGSIGLDPFADLKW